MSFCYKFTAKLITESLWKSPNIWHEAWSYKTRCHTDSTLSTCRARKRHVERSTCRQSGRAYTYTSYMLQCIFCAQNTTNVRRRTTAVNTSVSIQSAAIAVNARLAMSWTLTEERAKVLSCICAIWRKVTLNKFRRWLADTDHARPLFKQESPANAKGTRDSSACMKAHCEQM